MIHGAARALSLAAHVLDEEVVILDPVEAHTSADCRRPTDEFMSFL